LADDVPRDDRVTSSTMFNLCFFLAASERRPANGFGFAGHQCKR
jgi:hypothetical protein